MASSAAASGSASPPSGAAHPPRPSFVVDDDDDNLAANPFADDDERDRGHGHLYSSQQAEISKQDDHLDSLSASIARQQQLSLQMGDELDLHHELLNDFDDQADRTGLRLGGASDRLETLRRSVRENGSTYLIFGLIIVLILLIAIFK